jgi:AcrR family transcriptional regulator
MKTKSILNISIKEICENAGVSRSTFYMYYKDQYDLLGQLEEEILDEFDHLIQRHSPAGAMLPAKDLTVLIEAVLRYIVNNSNSIQVFLSENGESGFQRKFARYLTNHIRQFQNTQSGTVVDERTLKYYSVFIRDGAIAIIQEWLKSGMDLNVHEMAKVFVNPIRSLLG